MRQFGTNNLPDCSNMCHESSGTALSEAIGIGKGTVTLEDFEQADAIFVIGQNPGTNHPRMLTSLQQAARRGCEIVSINPLPEAGLNRFKHPQELSELLGPGTAHHRLCLPVRINGDVALLKGLMKELLERGVAAARAGARPRLHPRATRRLRGVRARPARRARWDEIVEQSGVPREQIRAAAADPRARSERMIFCWAMGLTQHQNAVANIQEIVNLVLLRGSVGKPGAGLCPVRGHSNVQGDRTMGIWEKPSPAFLEALDARVRLHAAARRTATTRSTRSTPCTTGEVKVFFALGGNFLSATPGHRVHRRGAAPHAG